MGHKRNTISDSEHKQRSLKLIEAKPQNWNDIIELFFLYNDRMEPRKPVSNCGACKAYVWDRLKQYYLT